MSYQFDFSVVADNAGVLLRGALLTIQLSIVAMLGGFVIAVVTVLGRNARFPAFRWLARIYVEVVRNTPFLLQLFFLFFGLPSIGVALAPNLAATIALSINGGAYTAEIVRGGILSMPRGQPEAGLALGLTRLQVFRLVVFKPALRAVYPALTGQFILLLLSSSVVASISATELTAVAQSLDSMYFRSFEIYFAVTAIYLAISVGFSKGFVQLGRVLFAYPLR